MNYPELGKSYLARYQIDLDVNSTCWGRTHSHGSIFSSKQLKRICKCELPKTRISLLTFLHEVGHIVHPQGGYKGTKDGNAAKTRGLAEYNATQWALEEMRKNGVKAKRKQVQAYNRYVTDKIARGIRRGGKVPKELQRLKPKTW